MTVLSAGAGERARMDALELVTLDWAGTKAKRYDGEQFILTSAAPDEVTRRAAVRLAAAVDDIEHPRR